MISKELLNEVLGYEASYIQMVGTKLCFSCHIKGGSNINIYELANKCKEWAMQTPYIVDQLAINIDRICLPNKFKTRYWCVWLLRYRKVSEEFYADTEPEAIFKACQWILDNKEDK